MSKVLFAFNLSSRNFLRTQTRTFKSTSYKQLFAKRPVSIKPKHVWLLGSGATLTLGTLTAYSKREEINLSQYLNKLLDLLFKRAFCEEQSNKKRNRTAFYEKTLGTEKQNAPGELGSEDQSEEKAKFDWKEFGKLIWDQKFYFLAAIAVSFYLCLIKCFLFNFDFFW